MAKKTAEIVFVNDDKYQRAVDIVALVTGKRSLKKNSEVDVQNFWADKLSALPEKASEEAKVRLVYEGLGGLVRTHAEEAKAESVKKEMTAALKKGKGGKKGK